VSLRLSRNGALEVVIPWRQRMSAPEVEAFVASMEGWIERNRRRLGAVEHTEFHNRATIPWRGRDLPLSILAGHERNSATVTAHACRLHVREPGEARRTFAEWAIEQCKHLYREAVLRRAGEMQVDIAGFRIGDAHTRWGSCSARGRLTFSWRLAMAPPEVFDAVVVHELAHRIELNHSPAFYAVVRKHCPDYDRLHRWLKDHGRELLLV